MGAQLYDMAAIDSSELVDCPRAVGHLQKRWSYEGAEDLPY